MIDSLVVVGREVAAGLACVPVVEDDGGESEESSGDAAGEAGECAAAVSFEAELALEGVED